MDEIPVLAFFLVLWRNEKVRCIKKKLKSALATAKSDFKFTARLPQPRKEISSSRRGSCNHEKRFQVHGDAPATTKRDFKFTARLSQPRKEISSSRR